MKKRIKKSKIINWENFFFSLFTFILSFFLLMQWHSYAQQPGDIDTTFNPTDIGFGNGDGADNYVYTMVIQSDGKIIIGGAFTSYNGTGRNHIARLNTDGGLDSSFAPGTGANGGIYSTVIQGDGKIIITGSFSTYNGTGRNRIARLNADGGLDTSFNPGTGADTIIYTSLLQSDGKIIIAGNFTSYNGTGRNRIARLNADGGLDTSFGPGTGADNGISATTLRSDGKIIIAGSFSSYNGTGRNHIALLNSDGGLDTSFDPGTGTNNNVTSTELQSDGKIIIAGYFSSYNGTARNCIARLNTDGGLDASFNPGTGANIGIYTNTLQGDGKIIIGGLFTSYNGTTRNRLARLNANGGIDTSFAPVIGANNTVFTSAIQNDGKIIIGGAFSSYNGKLINFITRLNTNGELDTLYDPGPGTGANSVIYTTAIQSDGKIIIGGFFTSFNGIERNRIARLYPNGELDTSFDPDTGANNWIYSTAIQSDGKIIITGEFTFYNGTSRSGIARLNADGTLDTSFDPGSGTDSYIYTTAIQSDGKIIIGGDFTSYNGTPRTRIARLNADGGLDSSFVPGSGADNRVYTIAIQSDGKIIIGGGFLFYDGTPRSCIARLNANGGIDASFNQGLGANNTVHTTAIQGGGKIIIGGYFTSYNGTTRNRIARLNADGSLDTSFAPGTGTDSWIYTTALQSDGKIIIAGDFTSYNGTTRSRIARLNAGGGLDTSFDPGTGANFRIPTTAIQSDGKIIIGGYFTSYNGTGRNRICRIFGSTPCLFPNISKADVSCFGLADGWAATSVSGGSTPYTYLWSNSSSNDTIGNLNSGTYTVTITDSDSCIAIHSATIYEPPDLIVNLGNDTIICSTCSLTLNAGNPGAIYQWSYGATTQVITVTGAGTYFVTVTDVNGCSQSDTIVVSPYSGIQSAIPALQPVIIFPNPTNDKIFITLPAKGTFGPQEGIPSQFFIQIQSVSGLVVYSGVLSNIEKNTIDISSMLPGIYIGSVSGNETKHFFKIVKQQ